MKAIFSKIELEVHFNIVTITEGAIFHSTRPVSFKRLLMQNKTVAYVTSLFLRHYHSVTFSIG